MKRLLLILILTFNFQSWAMSEVDIGNLFGVKILDDVKLYANENDGVEHDVRPNIFFFSDEVIDIKRNEDFDRFYLRTDNKFKIINITGKRFLPEKNKTFVNNCLTEKNKLIEGLSIFLILLKMNLNKSTGIGQNLSRFGTSLNCFMKKMVINIYYQFIVVTESPMKILVQNWVSVG